jgi:sarcosine oxidase subunit beta
MTSVDSGPVRPGAHLPEHPDFRWQPIVGRTPYEGLYLNCGWGTGGFKATPGIGACLAHTIAHDEPHPYVASFGLERFVTGALIDEHGAAGVAH